MLTLDELHTQIAASIAAITPTVPGPWRESRHPYQVMFDAPEIEHHGFALWLPSTESLLKDRQNAATGTRSKTEILVRWAHRIRVEGAVIDTKAAYKAERDLTAAIKATDGIPLVFETATRNTIRDGLVLTGEQRWSLHHSFHLST